MLAARTTRFWRKVLDVVSTAVHGGAATVNQLLDGWINIAQILIHGQAEKMTLRKLYSFIIFNKMADMQFTGYPI